MPALFVLFVGSGAAALIYEIVWFQLLELFIGSSSVSIGVLLGTFMGGMCLGSLLLARVISPRRHPLRVYAGLELGIGAFGLLLLFVLPLVGRIYLAWGGDGLAGFLLRGVAAAICLLPPTLAMGATLPAVARWVETTPDGVSRLGIFYTGNIAGAVVGSLVAGFYLLRVYDMRVTTFVAVGLDVLVALAALRLAASRTSITVENTELAEQNRLSPPSVRSFSSSNGGGQKTLFDRSTVYLAIALSGFCALAGEVIWTRLLGLLFGATVYTFSLILAVFLIGLGIGSGLGAALSKQVNPRAAFGWCQSLVVAAVAWAAHELALSLPYWPINPAISVNIWLNFRLDFLRALWVVLPPAVLWGASFPLALASIAKPGQDPGRLVGAVYAANTIGAVAGSLSASLLLIAWIGSQHAQQVMMGLSAVAGLLLLVPAVIQATVRLKPDTTHESRSVLTEPDAVSERMPARLRTDTVYESSVRLQPDRGGPPEATHHVQTKADDGLTGGGSTIPWAGTASIAASLIATAFLIRGVPAISAMLVAHGRFAATLLDQAGEIIYVGEGLQSSVAVSRLPNGALGYHNAGKIQASSAPEDMRLQRMLGHLTTLVPDRPRSVLVIGCGAGITAGAVSIDPMVDRVTIAEIEPLVPRVVSAYFGEQNHHVVDDPKVRVRIDDARHFLLTSRETFDAITSDPLDPWVKGAATLYTREFFEAARDHLNPGGVVTLFVQLYDSSPASIKSEIATFFDVFPNAIIAGNTFHNIGYDTVLMGQTGTMRIDLDVVGARLRRADYAPVAASLREIGLVSAVDLFATYAGRAIDLKPWTRDAAINLDRDLRLQYLAGLGLNMNESDAVYAEILTYRRYPADLFAGSDRDLAELRQRIEPRP